MVEHNEQRDAASSALIKLRREMGKTQQTFAVEVLDVAIGTVARYETSEPPRGEVLLRLADIAREQNLPELARIFERVWVENVPKIRSGSHLTADYLISHISGKDAYRGAQAFMFWLQQVDSPDPKIRKQALSLLKPFEDGVRKNLDPSIAAMQDALASWLPEKKGKTR